MERERFEVEGSKFDVKEQIEAAASQSGVTMLVIIVVSCYNEPVASIRKRSKRLRMINTA